MRLFLLLGVTLLTTIQASSPILLSSKRSIFTKKYSIDTSNLQSNSTTNQKNTSFTLNYQQTIDSPRLLSLVSFNKLTMDNKYKQIKVILYLTNTSTRSVSVEVLSAATSLITRLAIRVYVAGGLYSDPTKFMVGQAQLNPNKATWSYNKNISLSEKMKVADTMRIFHSLTGMSIQSNKATNRNANIMDISVTFRLVNTSSIRISFSSTYVSYVEMIRVNWLIFYLQSSSLANLTLFSSRLLNLKSQKSYQLSSYQPQYFYLQGMTGFSMQSNMQFDFQFKDDQSNKIQMSSNSNFKVFSLNILQFIPYFCFQRQLASDMLQNCKSKCPIGSYSDSKQFICKVSCQNGYFLNKDNQCQRLNNLGIQNKQQSSISAYYTYSPSGYSGAASASVYSKSAYSASGYSGAASASVYSKSAYSASGYSKSDYSKSDQSVSSEMNKKVVDNSLALKVGISLASCILVIIISFILYRKFCYKPIQILRVQNQQATYQDIFNRPQIPDKQNATEIVSEGTTEYRLKAKTIKTSKGVSQWSEMSEQYLYPKDIECTIDLLQKPTLRMSCSHYFHIPCILAWKKRNGNCPLCRKKVENVCYIHCEGCLNRYRQTSLKVIEKDISNTRQLKFRLCDDCL